MSTEKPKTKSTAKPVTTPTPNNSIKITRLTITVSSPCVIVVGKTKRISYSITPTNATNKTFKYASSKPAIAKVSNEGVITGVSPGITTLTITAEDGGNASASFPVHVVSKNSTYDSTYKATGILKELKNQPYAEACEIVVPHLIKDYLLCGILYNGGSTAASLSMSTKNPAWYCIVTDNQFWLAVPSDAKDECTYAFYGWFKIDGGWKISLDTKYCSSSAASAYLKSFALDEPYNFYTLNSQNITF